LTRSIDSALGQTNKNIELIVVDGGSTDGTYAIISDLHKKELRIKPVLSEGRLNFVKSLNYGISISKGQYIARLDSDDFWCDPNKLYKQVQFLESNPDYLLVGGGIIVINEQGEELLRILHPRQDSDIRGRMLFDSPFAHSTVVFRRDVCMSVGGYDERLDYCEDWDLWLRLGRMGKMYNFRDYFVCYTQGKHNRSNRVKDRRAAFKLRRKYRDDYVGFHKAVLLSGILYFYSFLPFSIRRLVRRALMLAGIYQ
jgi:glycosyltransferase involved in cell wall biosynthesis